jgi:hypothetical protein
MDDQPKIDVTAEEDAQRLAQFKQKAVAHFEALTGLTFDPETGDCTTPGEFEMEGENKVRWEALCNQMTEASAARDAQKVQELWAEMGKFFRGAIQQAQADRQKAER